MLEMRNCMPYSHLIAMRSSCKVFYLDVIVHLISRRAKSSDSLFGPLLDLMVTFMGINHSHNLFYLSIMLFLLMAICMLVKSYVRGLWL